MKYNNKFCNEVQIYIVRLFGTQVLNCMLKVTSCGNEFAQTTKKRFYENNI